ncbi:anti-CBASS protein Acb1 family protein [Enterobacter ludwigii]|uniref:anti-CBASS protein Acb1 family protein n=1 Tax=Enterobacter ludwigii TaxID=299767 RepID=UPI003BEEB3E8
MTTEVEQRNKSSPKAQNMSLADGLENLVTGLGTNSDKSTHNRWTNSASNWDWEQLMNRFREDWVSNKVCTIVPQDMCRNWRKISTEEGVEADKEFGVRHLFQMAYQWARLYGTSFLLLDLKGSGSLSSPLNLKRLKPGCIKSFQIIDRTRMVPTGMVCLDPLSLQYGLPEYYKLVGYPKPIHHTRFIRFEGTTLPLYQLQRNHWYSDSVLIPLQKTIDQYFTTAASAAQLSQEANVDIVTVQGLQGLLTNEEGEKAVLKRFRMMKHLKSVFGVVLLDETEEYSNKSIALSGVKDLIWEYLKIVAAAVGIPATRFLSASPDGLNATGESDLVNYIDLLAGLQTFVFDPRLKIVDTILQANFGIPEWKYEWNSIFPESSLERAKRAKDLTNSVTELVIAGVITPKVANSILSHEKVFGTVDLEAPPPIPPNINKENIKTSK